MTGKNFSSDKPIIFYDEICALCDHTIRFLILKDNENQLFFSPLQGKIASSLIEKKYTENLNTFVILYQGKIYVKSRAIKLLIKLIKTLYLYKWMLIIPNFIIDIGYTFIGKIRYIVFGKNDKCLYLNKDLKKKFIL